MNDSRLLLQEFHSLASEYGEKLPMTKMYRESLIRRIEAELQSPSYVQDKSVKEARQQLQWIAMQEDKAKEFEARGEERIPCFLGIEYVKKCAQVYRELSSCEPHDG